MSAHRQHTPSGPHPRPNREQVRQRLLDAALAEFRELGYAGARLAAIAHRAGFTKGAVYSNFASKQALLSALLAQHSEAVAAGIFADVHEMDVPAGIGHTSAALAAQLVEDPQWQLLAVEFALQAGRDPAVRAVYLNQRRVLRSRMAELLRAQAQRWNRSPRWDAERGATMLLATLYGMAVEHAADPEAVDVDIVREAVTAILNRMWL